MKLNRRTWLMAGTLGGIGLLNRTLGIAASETGMKKPRHPDLEGLTGVTIGSFYRNLASTPTDGKLWLLDLPKIMRDELGMKVLDLMTACFPTMEPAYLDDFRSRAEKAGCVITNLKMNQPDIDIGSLDAEERRRAIGVYKGSIDAAQRLGCRWVRPLPLNNLPSWERYVESYRELIDYAAPKGITLLVENYGWMKSQPEAIPSLIAAVGAGLDAAPDIGNWTDEARYVGLERAFPYAVTCDFKAFTMDANGRHADYDLKRCFDIGWDLGFRGPWCFEHFNGSLPALWKEMVMLREMIEGWSSERAKKEV